jgi:histidine triad (HIT) family protein
MTPTDPSCVFCGIVAGADRELFVIEDETWFVLPSLRQQPRNLGHMLVVPRAHHRNLGDLPPEMDGALLGLVRRVAAAVVVAFGASGTSIRQNNGPPGQDVLHLHVHVVPRFVGDDDGPGEWVVVDRAIRVLQADLVRGALLGL